MYNQYWKAGEIQYHLFGGAKRNNCLYRALTALSLSLYIYVCVCVLYWIFFVFVIIYLFFIYWQFVQLETPLLHELDLGFAVHFHEESVGQPPGCEATTWEIEGALAEWTGNYICCFPLVSSDAFPPTVGRRVCSIFIYIYTNYLLYIFLYVQCISFCMCIYPVAVDDNTVACTALRHVSRHFWLGTHSQVHVPFWCSWCKWREWNVPSTLVGWCWPAVRKHTHVFKLL